MFSSQLCMQDSLQNGLYQNHALSPNTIGSSPSPKQINPPVHALTAGERLAFIKLGKAHQQNNSFWRDSPTGAYKVHPFCSDDGFQAVLFVPSNRLRQHKPSKTRSGYIVNNKSRTVWRGFQLNAENNQSVTLVLVLPE